MISELYLLRHAKAVDRWPDPERELSPRGIKTSCRLGAALRRGGVPPPDLCLHSGYRRSLETAQHLLARWEISPRLAVASGWTPEADPFLSLSTLAGYSGRVLVVGHNPHLSLLISLLRGPDKRSSPFHFRKGTLALLRPPEPGGSAFWELVWSVSPPYPEMIADSPGGEPPAEGRC